MCRFLLFLLWESGIENRLFRGRNFNLFNVGAERFYPRWQEHEYRVGCSGARDQVAVCRPFDFVDEPPLVVTEPVPRFGFDLQRHLLVAGGGDCEKRP